jgi:hypothetical protein
MQPGEHDQIGEDGRREISFYLGKQEAKTYIRMQKY